MSKNLLLSLGVTSLLFTGCAMDSISYNNAVVDHTEEISVAWDNAYQAYIDNVPVDINETTVVDVTAMQTNYDTLSLLVGEVETDLMTKESRNTEQQAAVQASLTQYQSAANDYLAVYQEILNYYEGDFASNLGNAWPLEDKLYDADDVWVDAHNSLGDVLNSYIY